MSGSDWPLLGGNQGWNFPENYQEAVDEPVLLGLDPVHAEVHGAHHDPAARAGLGLALLVQESTRWKGVLRTSFLVPSALGLASASLLFYVLYSPIAGPFADLMATLGLHVPRHARRRAVVDALPHRVALRGLLHAAHARGPAGHPRRRLRGRPHRRRLALADVPQHHHPAPASRPSRSPRCCASPARCSRSSSSTSSPRAAPTTARSRSCSSSTASPSRDRTTSASPRPSR